ncbi:MAG: hypothetical protein MUF59_10515 [Candidatus Krumholzibacteria bacterium]|nr:hypothetical protein [Candidatus Krumholzibacteria bacterium]
MKPGSYTARLTTLTTGTLWMYSIRMLETSPATGNSWGSIKSLFAD